MKGKNKKAVLNTSRFKINVVHMSEGKRCAKCGILLSAQSIKNGNSYCYDCYTR